MHLSRILTVSAVATAALLSACSSLPETSQPVSGSYACGQLDIAVTGVEDSRRIGIDYLDQRLVLEPEASASGALYVASGDDQTRFWSKGEKATLTIQGQTYPECLQPGGLEMPFEARGNEPFWNVTIEAGELLLTRPFAEQGTYRVPVERQAADGQGQTFAASSGDLPLTLTVVRQRCEDSMSGAQYPAQVQLEVGSEIHGGCGGDRQRLFRGAIWVVEDIAGAGIIDRSRVTIEFLEDNRIAGRASCNQYTGSYKLGGEAAGIGALASARMACAPALMNQEDRFLGLLEQVNSMRIGAQGQLLLSTPGGDSIKAFPSGHAHR